MRIRLNHELFLLCPDNNNTETVFILGMVMSPSSVRTSFIRFLIWHVVPKQNGTWNADEFGTIVKVVREQRHIKKTNGRATLSFRELSFLFFLIAIRTD